MSKPIIPDRSSFTRWRTILPIVMVAVSVSLMLLAAAQRHPAMGSGWEVPARTVNFLINGPGFLCSFWLPLPAALRYVNDALDNDGQRLIGVALFWFVVGLTLDRFKEHRNLSRERPALATSVFSLGALLCTLLAVVGVSMLVWEGPLLGLADAPLRNSRTKYAEISVWFMSLAVYFFRRTTLSLTYLRRSKPSH